MGFWMSLGGFLFFFYTLTFHSHFYAEVTQAANYRQVLWYHGIISYPIYNWLVVYLPLWKIWKSVGIIIPNIWKNKETCSKPPIFVSMYNWWANLKHLSLRQHRINYRGWKLTPYDDIWWYMHHPTKGNSPKRKRHLACVLHQLGQCLRSLETGTGGGSCETGSHVPRFQRSKRSSQRLVKDKTWPCSSSWQCCLSKDPGYCTH